MPLKTLIKLTSTWLFHVSTFIFSGKNLLNKVNFDDKEQEIQHCFSDNTKSIMNFSFVTEMGELGYCICLEFIDC